MTPRYMLDTNICIHIRRSKPPRVLERLRALQPGEVGMSPIAPGELIFGSVRIRETTGFDTARRALADLAQLIPAARFDGSTAAPIGGVSCAAPESRPAYRKR
ncbi:hypothetical protein MKK75_04375 [Methylobacterium sp. J-030]|uniref:hypothetical protein n=1 Tax=Methylobacterium sp. J-030 TaxID=2836627 RepID=UPI001FB9EED8|nr:hypothetical protein [Methylobacterium sp. J-030]MCJ2068051.1 hypothetical protein [Methylobacterium sp. J-030]